MQEVAVQININTLLAARKLQFLAGTTHFNCYFYKDTNFIMRVMDKPTQNCYYHLTMVSH